MSKGQYLVTALCKIVRYEYIIHIATRPVSWLIQWRDGYLAVSLFEKHFPKGKPFLESRSELEE